MSGSGPEGATFLWEFVFAEPVEGAACVLHADGAPADDRDEVEILVRAGRLVVRGVAGGPFEIDMEDTRLYGRHQLQVIGDRSGTAFHLDGYVVWSTRRSLLSLGPRPVMDLHPDVRGRVVPVAELRGARAWTSEAECELRDRAPVPRPLVPFVAPALDPSDAREVGVLPASVIHARFRVRGPGQYGVVTAAELEGKEVFAVGVEPDGVRLRRAGTAELFAQGSWSDGRWHHLAVAHVDGAVELWVDGWLCAHAPGSAPVFDRLVVGQDLCGERLMGEVAEGGVHGALNDQQIARLARRPPILQVPVFDRWPTGAFHRIPALAQLADGAFLAVADARHGLPNDAPNVTDLVVARSVDGGRSWSEPTIAVGYPSPEDAPVSVTDTAVVEDSRGRVHLLVDLYAAGLGLLAARPGPGVPAEVEVTVEPDGTLRPATGEELGNVHVADTPATAVGHIVQVTSEDGGATWSLPRLITAQVKDEWMPFLGIGPGAGLRLRGPRWPGRLVVPCYFSDAAVAQFSAAVLLSDDDGVTWRRSGSTNADRIVAGRPVDERDIHDPAALMSEASVVELDTGVLVMFARSQRRNVVRSLSRDGGETWGEVTEDAMAEIFCQPAAAARGDVVYFANASRMLPYRGCGVVRRAVDVGAELDNAPEAPWSWQSRAINPRHHGYQSLVAIDGGVVMLWERETAGVWFCEIPDELFT